MSLQLNQLSEQALELIKLPGNLVIKKVVIGVLYTGIELKDGTVGVSFTLTDRSMDHEGYHSLVKDGLPSEKRIYELIEYCSSPYSILRSIGVAALNTYSQTYIDFSEASYLDILGILESSSDNVVGMVGNIHPISRHLAKEGKIVKILDKFMPPTYIKNTTQVDKVSDLEVVDSILVSGSALVFDNFDEIIHYYNIFLGKKS
ncbi:MAG: hypothetical protein JSW11_20115 [Candidatus Heimdallarchaeota archaeon]|nr:MAG: hypothetical protein JSW11_20115 [Candidatus Heimdallarchaeota archaeon]